MSAIKKINRNVAGGWFPIVGQRNFAFVESSNLAKKTELFQEEDGDLLMKYVEPSSVLGGLRLMVTIVSLSVSGKFYRSPRHLDHLLGTKSTNRPCTEPDQRR